MLAPDKRFEKFKWYRILIVLRYTIFSIVGLGLAFFLLLAYFNGREVLWLGLGAAILIVGAWFGIEKATLYIMRDAIESGTKEP